MFMMSSLLIRPADALNAVKCIYSLILRYRGSFVEDTVLLFFKRRVVWENKVGDSRCGIDSAHWFGLESRKCKFTILLREVVMIWISGRGLVVSVTVLVFICSFKLHSDSL